ncbi:hypothetical protein GPALN_004572 [Globodera pallida]|nr:hypothetical protein GPALN_004572 [Globodera pallida]
MLRMILNLLAIFISLNHLFIEIKAGNNDSSRRRRNGAASNSSRNRQAPSLQHLAERPSQMASSSSALESDGSNNVGTQCAICLESLLASEDVKKLGSCEHRFHRNCVDTWLGHGNTTCPMCRQQVDQNARPNHLPDCPLCRESMQASQIKELHSCRHSFHRVCVDSWLFNNGGNTTCPVCGCSVDMRDRPEWGM